mgnify:CR=1 FL=1
MYYKVLKLLIYVKYSFISGAYMLPFKNMSAIVFNMYFYKIGLTSSTP